MTALIASTKILRPLVKSVDLEGGLDHTRSGIIDISQDSDMNVKQVVRVLSHPTRNFS